ncbi:uncharacterized protein LOC127704156 [Mytilus californianus]|uniref:uncharacterized protein LOC127704156 n=1 Tax=Mytilus californianus TaxID=6549 RepID=UPI0022456FE1|nr:uncharacterized protein LOC127704156 [Mytilus californianus]
MTSSMPVCGVCDLRKITKPPTAWCPECEEGLCAECLEHHSLSKGTRKHSTIPITEYQKLPTDILQITENCDKHNERHTIYCKKHECFCCSSCIVEDHNTCRDLAKSTDIVQNIKTSNAFFEIEYALGELADNIKTIRQTQQNNLKKVSEKKVHILQEIKQTRITINNHLDKIQDDTIKKIHATEKNERKQIGQLVASLEEKENEISKCKQNIEKVKQHSTDLQAFVSMKLLEKEVYNNEQFLASIKNNLEERTWSYQVNNVIKDITSFGKIIIETKPYDVVLTHKKNKQAQTMVPRVLSRSIVNVSLKLHKTINTMGKDITGCCMLLDGRMVFADKENNAVRVLNNDGSNDFQMKIPTNIFEVAYISRDNTLAVTSGFSFAKCITLIDILNKTIKKTLPVESQCYGIAVQGINLVCSAYGEGIQLINPYNNTTSDVFRIETPGSCYLATFGDKLYHTVSTISSVTCYDLQGSIHWIFENESILRSPYGISVDNDGNVYVVGKESNNVVVISPDGQQYKEILNARDGLLDTQSLHYDRSTNQLLVANKKDKAMLFSSN